ncbi:MAG: hypothetical protein ACXW28_06255, partial [Thermoanaerobaculia bacterium]
MKTRNATHRSAWWWESRAICYAAGDSQVEELFADDHGRDQHRRGDFLTSWSFQLAVMIAILIPQVLQRHRNRLVRVH